MDLSGVIDRIRGEITTYVHAPSVVASLQFENHLYGCLTALEVLAEGADDLSGQVIHSLDDLSANFGAVGHEFGFFHDERCVHGGWSNSYRNDWLWLLQTVGKERRDLSAVEFVESALIATVTDASGAFRFFKVALQDGDIPDELYNECVGLIDSMKAAAKRKLRGTELTRRVHGRRAITPLRRRVREEDEAGTGTGVARRRFRRTRKQGVN